MDSLQPFASRTIDAFEMGCTECCDSEEEVDEVFAIARQLTDRSDRSDADDHVSACTLSHRAISESFRHLDKL